MYIIAVILLVMFAAIGLLVMNHGPQDKESARREAHWSKYDGK